MTLLWCDSDAPSEDFHKRFSTFIAPGASDIKSEYAYWDINSMFGSYEAEAELDATLNYIKASASKESWSIHIARPDTVEFHRVTRAGAPAGSSYEVVRAVAVPPSTVKIAWIEIDEVGTWAEVRKSAQWKWAMDEFWPKFDRSLYDQR